MVRKAFIDKIEHLAGGNGVVERHVIATADELGKIGRYYGKMVLAPGCSIGYHKHSGETEPYYILSGCGIFTDNDGSRIPVSAGDVCVINDNESHGIENASDSEDLVFMALIYNIL